MPSQQSVQLLIITSISLPIWLTCHTQQCLRFDTARLTCYTANVFSTVFQNNADKIQCYETKTECGRSTGTCKQRHHLKCCYKLNTCKWLANYNLLHSWLHLSRLYKHNICQHHYRHRLVGMFVTHTYKCNNKLGTIGYFLKSKKFLSQARNSPHFMEPEGSLAHAQESAICSCPKPTESSSCLPIMFLHDAL